jgi:CheY-like chemotaxis protein
MALLAPSRGNSGAARVMSSIHSWPNLHGVFCLHKQLSATIQGAPPRQFRGYHLDSSPSRSLVSTIRRIDWISTARTTVLKKGSSGSSKKKRQTTAIDLEKRTRDLEEANKTASYVAHELNNLLTVIQINTEFLLESAGENSSSAQELGEIQSASRRASILARQLLASSRLEPFDASLAEAALRKRTGAGSAKSAAIALGNAVRTSETILLVEDQASVRTLAKKILSQKGYRVFEAADGAIALRVAAAHVGEIDLVLTDVAMPNLGGRGMVEELRELSPGIRVLFMSGYPKEEVFPAKGSGNSIPYLQKPFTGEMLFSEVRAALGYVK